LSKLLEKILVDYPFKREDLNLLNICRKKEEEFGEKKLIMTVARRLQMVV
jgi:hypothetical protein